MQRARTPLRHATSLLAIMSMMLTFVVVGATSASAHSTSSNCAKPAAEGFLDELLHFVNVFSSFVSAEEVACPVKGENVDVKMDRDWSMPIASARGNARTTDAPCVDGLSAGVFACEGIDLAGHVSMVEMRLGRQDIPAGVNDIWGWTDPETNNDYAILGTTEGTVFVDITVPTAPRPLGMLPTASTAGFSDWRDIKVYEDHAFIVSEHDNHGVQVFDLTRLRDHSGKRGHFETYDMDAHYTGMGSSHNIAINEDTGFAYALGSGAFSSFAQPYSVSVEGGGSYLASGALFGPAPTEAGFSAPLFDTASTACNADPALPDLSGKIAIVDRGACFFSEKVLNAQTAGAIGAIVVSTDDSYLSMSPDPASGPFVTIPSVFLPSSLGADLRDDLPGVGTVFANDPPPICGDGLHMIDINDPKNPTYAGCESETGYVHDTQCVTYDGPDDRYTGREICFNSNGIGFGADAPNFFSIVDVTDKADPVIISSDVTYTGSAYSHQGWLTEDQGYFLFGDEGDELTFGVGTTTRVWDVSDLTAPEVVSTFSGETAAIDHNIYTEGDLAYASNYEAGLRLYDASDPAAGLEEVGFFDMYPEGDAATFDGGTWSNYAYFAQSDIVAVSSVDRGLFILRVHEDLLGD